MAAELVEAKVGLAAPAYAFDRLRRRLLE